MDRPWVNRLLICCALLIGFSPYLFIQFGFHNDFEIWSTDDRSCCSWFSETAHITRIGRGLQALLLNLYYPLFSTVEQLTYSRALSVGLTIMGALLLAKLMRREGWGWQTSAVFAAGAFLLAPMQINVAWTGNIVPSVLNAVVVLFAAYLFPKLDDVQSCAPRARTSLFLSVVVLFTSLFMYQPTVGLFLIPSLAMVLSSSLDRGRLKQVYFSIVVFTAVCAVYFGFHRFVFMKLYEISFPETAFYRFDVAFSPLANLKKFFGETVPVLMNLWNVAVSYWIAALVGAAIVWGIVRKRPQAKSKLYISVLALFLFLMINSPGLLAAGQPPSFYRAWHPGAVAVWLAFFVAIRAVPYPAARTAITYSCLFLATSLAFANNLFLSRTLSQQLSYAIEQVRVQYSENNNKYLMIEYRPPSEFLGQPRWGEFGFVHILAGSHVNYILKRYFKFNQDPLVTPIVAGEVSSRLLLEPELVPKSEKWPVNPENASVVLAGTVTSSAPADPAFRIQKAFDRIFYTFWEVPAKFPIDALINLKNPMIVRCLKIQGGDDGEADRMPNAWSFEGSDDGDKWEMIDEQKDQRKWKANQVRHYTMNPTKAYQFYRIRFLATNGDSTFRVYELALSEDPACAATVP